MFVRGEVKENGLALYILFKWNPLEARVDRHPYVSAAGRIVRGYCITRSNSSLNLSKIFYSNY